ncbi:MAG: hypothetical protein LUH09_09740 [Clostridiales bacterium]|nr:hypothetical protein [Clostridiales bacterium]
MKKVLSVAIAILLCILFAGCGTAQSENGDVEENTTVEENVTAEENTSEENSADETGDSGDSKEIEILSIGDTVSTDSAEFTLLDFQITTKASLESGDDFYAPVDEDYSGDCFYAEDGYVLAYISYSFQNIGKTDLRGVSRDLAGGGTIYGATGTHYLIDIGWDDGYMFGGDEYAIGIYWENESAVYGVGYSYAVYGSSYIGNDSSCKLDVLSDTQTFKCYFSLPDNVVEDENTPMTLDIYLPQTQDDGTIWGTVFTYSVR